jgi:chromosome segregation ATPase
MSRSLPIGATATKSFLPQLIYSLALTLLWVTPIAAQQPASRQRSPSLNTDDVTRPQLAEPPAETKSAAVKPEEAGKPAAGDAKPGEAKTNDAKASPEESSWRDHVDKARTRAKQLERAAEEAELRITALRNELGVSGESARHRNETAAELDQAGQQLKALRGEARVAADDLAQLVEYGTQKGFTEAAEPKATEEGKANEGYYRTRFAKLNEAVDTAQRRISLYENRVRDLTQQLSANGAGKDSKGRNTGGDSFFAAQLLKDREDAQQKLDEARAAYAKAQADIDALRDEARRAGVPPGLFR